MSDTLTATQPFMEAGRDIVYGTLPRPKLLQLFTALNKIDLIW